MPNRKTPRRTHRKGTGTWICLMICLIGELFFYTWCRVEAVRLGYEISQAGRNHQSLAALQNNLNIELARLKSPQRLARIAEKQLDLTMPKPEQMIVIR